MRSAIKSAAEAALARSGLGGVVRWSHRRRTVVLAYHNIVPDGGTPGADRSLHLPRAAFARQLDLLRETHDVVPLDELLVPPRQTRPRAAITFDDAYRGAVTVGVEELARRGMPATIFVSPAFVGGHSFWWDAVRDRATGGLPESVRTVALTELGGQDAAVRRWAAARGHAIDEPEPHARAATDDELRAALRTPGIDLGSHTWSHPALPGLSDDQLRQELEQPLDWLRERFTRVVEWLSYPYGLADARVARMAAQAGYRGALLVSGGWWPQSASGTHALPRVNIPAGLSPDGFRLRMAGLFCR